MRRARAATLLAVTLTVLAGCSGGTKTAEPASHSPSSSPSAKPSTGSLKDAKALTTLTNDGLAIDVLSVQHVGSGLAIARYRLRNVAENKSVEIGRPYNFVSYESWDFSFSRIFLVDLGGARRYHPPKAAKKAPIEEDHCLCTNTYNDLGGLSPELEPGGKPKYAWAAYTLPKDVDHVAVQDMYFGFAGSVPVSPADANLPHVKGELGADELVWKDDPESALRFRSDSSARHAHNNGEKVTVEVASDVLFAFDKAKLSGKAGTQLDQVANRIKTEADGPVTVTGYTDSKGSTSYNKKLSKKRARAVRDALDKRLDKPTPFKVSGKGEANPVAPNRKNGQDNPKGRKRNRRVEVSYTRSVHHDTSNATPATSNPTASQGTALGDPVNGSKPYTKGLQIQVTGLQRLNRGALLTFTITNTSSAPVDADQWSDNSDLGYHGGDAYWVNLEDATDTRYPVVAASNNRCLCTFEVDSQIDDLDSEVDPGATSTAWAVLSAPPAGTNTVDVHFHGYGTVRDVPISG